MWSMRPAQSLSTEAKTPTRLCPGSAGFPAPQVQTHTFHITFSFVSFVGACHLLRGPLHAGLASPTLVVCKACPKPTRPLKFLFVREQDGSQDL